MVEMSMDLTAIAISKDHTKIFTKEKLVLEYDGSVKMNEYLERLPEVDMFPANEVGMKGESDGK